ncbi:restless-like transposase [Pochonia chlamydosporia 170]|uniref:Restless-like transposase n=3 Tax=Pochonia chlamydosporia 170 TaxID=1380566 RepID=A0A219AQD8_METCM|nr:restless-like transposase [Pochonia chlamydosporia 170]XP_022284888.1 restless-like transposase [Pochonia chlamydosporia 170]OWT42252.1 restless-like transposase [Pochonia chlamydosporia 170]OWT42355.1 restless-like transposase [Pochonia chlamydosporia 170]
MSASEFLESSPISIDDVPIDFELPVPSTPASSAESSLTPFSPPPTTLPTPDKYDTRLWGHFPGWVWSERSKDNYSWAWEYGYDIQHDDERRWVCKPCIQKNDPRPKNFVAIGLQNALNHLYKDHGISAPDNKTKSGLQKKAEEKPGSKRPRSIVDIWKLDPLRPREQAIANSMIRGFNRNHFQRLLIEWIVDTNQPFSVVEHERLRDIFEYLNPAVKITNANISDTTVRALINSEFKKHKARVIEALRKSPGLIHVSFDGWRARNRHSLYGIVCFFRDENSKPHKVALGVPEVRRHSGNNIATEVLYTIEAFGIEENIGYFTLDNAENNDTALEAIGKKLGFNGARRRGRCFGHIVNLSAKALLFGKDTDAFEEQLSGAEALSEAEYELWRQKGPVGKLHNFVVDINRSDRLTYLLKELQEYDISISDDPKIRSKSPVSVVLDNDTRWLSQLYMIRRALRLRRYFELLVAKFRIQWEEENTSKRTGQLKKSAVRPRILRDENQLTANDWSVLQHFATILGYYEDAVKTLEGDGLIRKRKRGYTGSYGNVWDVINGFEFLLGKLEKYKAMAKDFPDPEQFRIGINMAWEKLDKYYTILDTTPIYYTALALHPAYRWGWFEQAWVHKPDWIRSAKRIVQEVWDESYRDFHIVVASNDEPVAKRQKQYYNAFEEHCEQSRIDSIQTEPLLDDDTIGDEYERWQSSHESTDKTVRDPIAYWHEKRLQYPRLSRMALDFVTIQSMSAECERMFSAAGQMVVPQRCNLQAQTVGMCQVLRSWFRAGIINDLDPLFLSIIEEKKELEGIHLNDDEFRRRELSWLAAAAKTAGH